MAIDQEIYEEREALCHMAGIEIDVMRSAWMDASGFVHHWRCRLHVKGTMPARYYAFVEGLELGDWWAAINLLKTS